jgi:hypothetical protein
VHLVLIFLLILTVELVEACFVCFRVSGGGWLVRENRDRKLFV